MVFYSVKKTDYGLLKLLIEEQEKPLRRSFDVVIQKVKHLTKVMFYTDK